MMVWHYWLALLATAVAIPKQVRDTLLVAATAAVLVVATAAATPTLHSHHSSRIAATLRRCHSSCNAAITSLPQLLHRRHSSRVAGCHSSRNAAIA